MLRIKYLMIFMFVSSYALSQGNYLHCSIDLDESSSYKKLNFGVADYEVPDEHRYSKIYVPNNNRVEAINEMAKKGWELEKQNENILYFKLNLQKPQKLLYCSIDIAESSSYKKLNFGVADYEVPNEHRYSKIYVPNNNKVEAINEMAKKGWELLDNQNKNTLYFKLDLQQPKKYLYCSLDLNQSSSYKKVSFGVEYYMIPTKYRGLEVYAPNNDRIEIINEMTKKGWELDNQNDNLLYFKLNSEQPSTAPNYLSCSLDLSQSSSYKKVSFGVEYYMIPTKYRGLEVYAPNNDRIEIVNEMTKKGWDLPKEIQYGEKLYFKIRIN